MSYAGWLEIWHAIVALVGREPIFTQIMIWLGGAFAAVMCLEGLRISFFPRRWLATRMTRPLFEAAAKADAPAKPESKAGSENLEPRVATARLSKKPVLRDASRRNRKRKIRCTSRVKPIKPQIRRYPANAPMVSGAPEFEPDPLLLLEPVYEDHLQTSEPMGADRLRV